MKITLSTNAIITISTLSAALIFQGCGGSSESSSSSSAPSSSQVEQVASSSEPTVANMKSAIVDAIQTISTDTVAEITNLAKNQEVIEIPDSFEKVQSALESAGQSDLFKGFSSSLNNSAVSALGDYKSVLKDKIGALDIPAVESIMQGGDDSLTRYVESAAGSKLKNSLVPLVKGAVKDAGAQEWIDKIKGALPEDTCGLLGQVSAIAGVQLPTNFDVEGYVTDDLMTKFFGVMANQEKLFRQDPKGRSADLFKKVMEATAQ